MVRQINANTKCSKTHSLSGVEEKFSVTSGGSAGERLEVWLFPLKAIGDDVPWEGRRRTKMCVQEEEQLFGY